MSSVWPGEQGRGEVLHQVRNWPGGAGPGGAAGARRCDRTTTRSRSATRAAARSCGATCAATRSRGATTSGAAHLSAAGTVPAARAIHATDAASRSVPAALWRAHRRRPTPPAYAPAPANAGKTRSGVFWAGAIIVLVAGIMILVSTWMAWGSGPGGYLSLSGWDWFDIGKAGGGASGEVVNASSLLRRVPYIHRPLFAYPWVALSR